MGIIDIQGISGIFSGVGTFAKDLRTTITGEISAEKKAEILARAEELEAAAANAQVELNKTEAASPSIFVSGWRPATGWICALGLFYGTIGKPILEFIARLFGFIGEFPTIDNQALYSTLFGMLGLGTMRVVEKVKGVARSS